MVTYLCDKCCKAKGLQTKFRRILHECSECHEVKLCSDDKPLKEFARGKK